MKRILLIAVILLAMLLSACGSPANLPNARDLCLSVHRYDLGNLLDEDPIPDDEFSQEYPPYTEYASSDYETNYYRVFFTRHPIDIRNTHLEITSGYSLKNGVRVYRSVEKAKKGFTDMSAPRFGLVLVIAGIAGIEWDIRSVGDESKAWYYVSRVLDEDKEIMRKQIEAVIYFRKGYVVSSVEVTTWGGPYSEESSLLEETASFLLNVAEVSETKISESISLK